VDEAGRPLDILSAARYAAGAPPSTSLSGMKDNRVTLIANGDLRHSANRNCWPAQQEVEEAVTRAFGAKGYRVERGHAYDAEKGHGFIDSQRRGMDVFREIPPDRPLVIAFAAWQYSHHILHGLTTHRAPILTIANWSGRWPGLVGMLNLNGCLAKAGTPYSTLWSDDFRDGYFTTGLSQWLETGRVAHDLSHVHPAERIDLPPEAAALGTRLAHQLRREKAIMGIFDEGCMGMYNAIIPDELLHQTGVFKERLSQSTLYYEAMQVSDSEARACRDWLDARGMQFRTGTDPETDLTDDQILLQLKTYVAALRIADDFGCDTIGIQYQQGLKDLLPASDLAEGLLNNTERPPAFSRDGRRELYAGHALPHFNEVDECAGLDALLTHRIWTALGLPPETTLHDVRWGEEYDGEYVWVFEISGAAPPAHFIGGYEGAVSERQPSMYFRLGGGTVKGVSKPGEIVWSRIYVEAGRLKADVGRARVVSLPDEETERRWQATTSQWPIMHAVMDGVSRNQMMARHKANHIQVAYAPDAKSARAAMAAKVATFQALGIETYVCGAGNGLV
jgi:hypothetical protein